MLAGPWFIEYSAEIKTNALVARRSERQNSQHLSDPSVVERARDDASDSHLHCGAVDEAAAPNRVSRTDNQISICRKHSAKLVSIIDNIQIVDIHYRGQ